MDFAYFNAILKTRTFPAYDPWFAGGYLNYYYFGFVLVGTPVKLIGLIPSFAYNLIMPTVLAIIFAGGFSLSWNLFLLNNQKRQKSKTVSPWLIGGAGASFLAILGNLGTIRMFIVGFAELGAQKANTLIEMGNFFEKIWWGIQGFFYSLAGNNLPYYLSDYYWWPSRVIRAAGEIEPITEFPFFTFIYADPTCSFLFISNNDPRTLNSDCNDFQFEKKSKPSYSLFSTSIFAGMTIAVLYMTNTWDYPVYFVFFSVKYFNRSVVFLSKQVHHLKKPIGINMLKKQQSY